MLAGSDALAGLVFKKIVTTNRVPSPRLLSTRMVPFIICTRLWVMARPRAGALNRIHPGVFRPFKGVNTLPRELLGHADPIVLHQEFKAADPALTGELFFHFQGDVAAFTGVLFTALDSRVEGGFAALGWDPRGRHRFVRR